MRDGPRPFHGAHSRLLSAARHRRSQTPEETEETEEIEEIEEIEETEEKVRNRENPHAADRVAVSEAPLVSVLPDRCPTPPPQPATYTRGGTCSWR